MSPRGLSGKPIQMVESMQALAHGVGAKIDSVSGQTQVSMDDFGAGNVADLEISSPSCKI